MTESQKKYLKQIDAAMGKFLEMSMALSELIDESENVGFDEATDSSACDYLSNAEEDMFDAIALLRKHAKKVFDGGSK